MLTEDMIVDLRVTLVELQLRDYIVLALIWLERREEYLERLVLRVIYSVYWKGWSSKCILIGIIIGFLLSLFCFFTFVGFDFF